MPWRQSLGRDEPVDVVWYHLNFSVPDLDDIGERVLLWFSSIDAEARIWVNEVLVNDRGYPHNGNYESWNELFSVDITEAVRGGTMNSLFIRVRSRTNNGGITSSVRLQVGE